MQRITAQQLDHMARFINKALGAPTTYHARDDNGNTTPYPWQIEVGHYHISGAYGGVCLHRTDNEHGGVTDVFNCGHVPKRDLYNRMRAYLEGIERAVLVMQVPAPRQTIVPEVELEQHYNPQTPAIAAQILHERHAANPSNTDES
jgi:hypothetical protein